MMYRIIVCTMLFAVVADAPAASIDTARLSSIVEELASDEYQGRAPGTPGGRKTVDYLVAQFRALGLEPGGDDGTWTDNVPMIHTLFDGPGEMRFVVDGESHALQQKVDIEASTVRAVDAIDIDAPVIFVGFGAYAPERDWDDYGDIDLQGKVALYLVNDPDFAAQPGEPAAGRFGDRKMTYYGRWAYKFEEAARRGAIAALVIHETAAAGYGWNVVQGNTRPRLHLNQPHGNRDRCLIEGWIPHQVALSLFESVGEDLPALSAAAAGQSGGGQALAETGRGPRQ